MTYCINDYCLKRKYFFINIIGRLVQYCHKVIRLDYIIIHNIMYICIRNIVKGKY